MALFIGLRLRLRTNSAIIADRIIKSMQEHPDKWKLVREHKQLWAKHQAHIDVACNGRHWVDINDDASLKTRGAPLSLGWWQHRRIRAAAKALICERLMRTLDRHELLKEQ